MTRQTPKEDRQEFRWFRAEALRFFEKDQIESTLPLNGSQEERTEILEGCSMSADRIEELRQAGIIKS